MLVESVPTQMVGNYFMRSRCQLITSPFWARYKKRTSPGSSHPPPAPTCAVKCTNAFNIMKFICSSSVPASLPFCQCVPVSVQGLSGSKLQLHREWETATATATGHGSVRGAWQHQQLQQQTCPTKSSVPRRLTLNFFHLSAASQVETRIVALCLKIPCIQVARLNGVAYDTKDLIRSQFVC